MPKVFVSFGKMLTLMLVDKAESSIWKFNVNGIKKYLHSGFYFNFENTLLLSDIKYFWINHILNLSNFWALVIFWTMWPELFYPYCYVKHISFPWGGHWSENVICNSAWNYFPVVFPFDGFPNIQNFSSLTPYSFKHFHKKCLFTIKSSLFCFLFSV